MQLAAAMSRLGTESAFEVLARATRLRSRAAASSISASASRTSRRRPTSSRRRCRALRDGHHGYTPANGILPLREAVAADMTLRRGVEVEPGAGRHRARRQGDDVHGDRDVRRAGCRDHVSRPRLSDLPLADPVDRARRRCRSPLHEDKGFAFSADEVLGKITPRTRLLIVNSPANPTGGVVPKAELDRLVAGLADHPQVVVMSDEIYARMCYDGVPHASMMAYPEIRDRLILLDGWSKTYAMTGWRLGWGVWPERAGRARDAARHQHPFLRQRRRPSGPASRR